MSPGRALAPASGLTGPSGLGTRHRIGIEPATSPKSGPILVTAVLFVLIFVVGGVRYRGFFSGQVFLNLLIDNSYLIVLAIGMSFVIITGGIDLSVGAVVALSTHDRREAAADGLVAGGRDPADPRGSRSTLGLLVGLMIHVFKVQPFIATLAAMFLARGLCYIIAKESISITHPRSCVAMANLRIPLGGRPERQPERHRRARRRWRSRCGCCSTPASAARSTRSAAARQSGMLMGLPTSRTKVLVYVISGFCSGLAGVLFAFYTLSGYALTAVGTELDAIAAVVIGGTLLSGGYGFVLGSVLGVLVLG